MIFFFVVFERKPFCEDISASRTLVKNSKCKTPELNQTLPLVSVSKPSFAELASFINVQVVLSFEGPLI